MPRALFTPAQVAEIRRQRAAGTLSAGQWARDLGCSRETIARVARGDSYNRTAFAGEPEAPADDAAALASLARFRAVAAETPPAAPEVQSILDDLAGRRPGKGD